MKLLYNCLFFWFYIFISCNSQSISQKDEFVSNSIISQRDFTNKEIEILLQAQLDRMRDPYVAVRIINWNEIIQLLDKKKEELVSRLNSLHDRLRSDKRKKLLLNEAIDASNFLLEAKIFLRDVLRQAKFKNNELQKAEALAKACESSSEFLPQIKLNTSVSQSLERFAVGELKEMLLKIQGNDLTNMILCMEADFFRATYQLMMVVYEASTYHSHPCEVFAPLVSVNSLVFSTGGTIEISAGIGKFQNIYQPSYVVDGHRIEPQDENPVIVYKSKVPMKRGKYSIPFQVEYLLSDGTKSIFTKQIYYQVR